MQNEDAVLGMVGYVENNCVRLAVKTRVRTYGGDNLFQEQPICNESVAFDGTTGAEFKVIQNMGERLFQLSSKLWVTMLGIAEENVMLMDSIGTTMPVPLDGDVRKSYRQALKQIPADLSGTLFDWSQEPDFEANFVAEHIVHATSEFPTYQHVRLLLNMEKELLRGDFDTDDADGCEFLDKYTEPPVKQARRRKTKIVVPVKRIKFR